MKIKKEYEKLITKAIIELNCEESKLLLEFIGKLSLNKISKLLECSCTDAKPINSLLVAIYHDLIEH